MDYAVLCRSAPAVEREATGVHEETISSPVIVITGAGAGVGRAVAEEFARRGCSVALLSRDVSRLEHAASELKMRYHIQTLAIPTDVASAEAVEAAAERVERELGPIHTWINVAMATVFGAVSSVSAAEVERGTQVTYLGQVYGMMAALKHMRPRNEGVIVNVGSALAYRSLPLQAIYCGAKAAIRGFTDSLRSELIHDKLAIRLTTVDLPAVNTPQFDWALNKTGYRPQPVPPIFQPEVPARAIYFAATHKRREIWLGFSTIKAILANRLAPGLLDRYLAKAGYAGQLTHQKTPSDAPSNLFEPVPGPYGAHGRFDARARNATWTIFTERHRALAFAILAVVAGVALGRMAKRRDL
ncbi:MAG TPA: SDR family oxidoreductase [Steroidobacteraceae bacterium]|nr:SDR family oxidoreductase [Steroidobacteraceae bacterium]